MTAACVAALGFFDGVHLGHVALLERTRAKADALGLPAVAMSFDIPPETLVRGAAPRLLTSAPQRERLLRRRGMDEVCFVHFDRAMMEKPWERFLREDLMDTLHTAWLVCGYDFRFGHRGEGTAAMLRAAMEARGGGCDIIDPVRLDGQIVSSTYIRSLIADGQVARARRFLGRPYTLLGTVTHGGAVGRTMGTPTANLLPEPGVLIPARGVYLTRVSTGRGDYAAVTNIGVRPTLGGGEPTIESWLLDYSGDLYGKTIELHLYEFLRPERRFASLSLLQAEIMKNAKQARAYFAGLDGGESEEFQ